MRRNQANEFSGCYDFGFLPESRKVPRIAGHQIVCSGSIGTFQEYVVIGVVCDFKAPCWSHDVTVALDKRQELLPKPFANTKLGAAKHIAVFLQDGAGHIETSRFGNGQEEDCARQPRRSDSSGNQDVCVNYQTEGKHHRFDFRDRDILIIWSIRREVNVLVPFRSDSSPMTLKTSGSGAASLT